MLMRPGGKSGDWRFGDDMERSALAHMPRGAIEPIKQVSAAWTRQLALGPVHETVQNERVVWTKQLRHLHFFRHACFADALEDVVLGHLAAKWQRATLLRNGFDLCPKRYLIIQKRISRGAILSAFIGVMEIFRGCGDPLKPADG